MKEPGDLLFLHRNLTGFDVDKGMFEELALNVGRQIVPPQEHRRAEVLKDARFLLEERYPLLAASSLYRPKGAALSLPPGKGAGVWRDDQDEKRQPYKIMIAPSPRQRKPLLVVPPCDWPRSGNQLPPDRLSPASFIGLRGWPRRPVVGVLLPKLCSAAI
jgi:hypothetical protein